MIGHVESLVTRNFSRLIHIRLTCQITLFFVKLHEQFFRVGTIKKMIEQIRTKGASRLQNPHTTSKMHNLVLQELFY